VGKRKGKRKEAGRDGRKVRDNPPPHGELAPQRKKEKKMNREKKKWGKMSLNNLLGVKKKKIDFKGQKKIEFKGKESDFNREGLGDYRPGPFLRGKLYDDDRAVCICSRLCGHLWSCTNIFWEFEVPKRPKSYKEPESGDGRIEGTEGAAEWKDEAVYGNYN
jgi:hypothetical protein